MFDLSSFLISAAYAADAVPETPPMTVQGEAMRFLPLFLIFMVFYFLLIRPQQKREEQQDKMRGALMKGDKVFLSSGFLGTIVKVEENDVLLVELAKGVQVKVLRSAVAGRDNAEAKGANENSAKS